MRYGFSLSWYTARHCNGMQHRRYQKPSKLLKCLWPARRLMQGKRIAVPFAKGRNIVREQREILVIPGIQGELWGALNASSLSGQKLKVRVAWKVETTTAISQGNDGSMCEETLFPSDNRSSPVVHFHWWNRCLKSPAQSNFVRRKVNLLRRPWRS